MLPDLTGPVLLFCGVSIATAALILIGLNRLSAWRIPIPPAAGADGQGTSFLFSGETLLDATPSARFLLSGSEAKPEESDWQRLLGILSDRFPTLNDAVAEFVGTGEARIPGPNGASGLVAEWWDGMVRFRLLGQDADRVEIHPVTLAAMEHEVALFRGIAEDIPHLAWRTNRQGQITWASQSYLDLADSITTEPGQWPPPVLFDPGVMNRTEGSTTRAAVAYPEGGPELWFDVTAINRDGATICFATEAGQTIAAEETAGAIVKTLSQTFADLSVGLAIFDRDRRLAVFNPALTDLTGLSPSFLVSRPHITAFLDRLRNANMLPEPKNYKSWREQVADLESAAERGAYAENWTLPGGQTYSVTGRPHPGGAIALMIEDISEEVTLTRQYRAELETAQAVLDLEPDALAVFSPSGTLRMSNSAYAAEWGSSAESLGDVRLSDEVERWKIRCAPTPYWATLTSEDRLGQAGDDAPQRLRLMDGRVAHCRVQRLVRGDVLVRFTLVAQPEAQGLGLAQNGAAPVDSGSHPAKGSRRRARN